jgi:hypothetical protein
LIEFIKNVDLFLLIDNIESNNLEHKIVVNSEEKDFSLLIFGFS